MKFLIFGLFSFYNFLAIAGDRPFEDFKHIVQDEVFQGTGGIKTTCSIKTKWQKNGDLVVTAVSQYADHEPRKYRVVFNSDSEYLIEHENEDESVYEIQKSTPVETDHERVYIAESFKIFQDASGVKTVRLEVLEVNDHSDASEIFFLVCNVD